MNLRAFGCFLTLAVLLVLLVAKRDHIYDEFVEGDDDPRFLEEGRHAGEWVFRGDERDLARFAGAPWHRIRFDLAPAGGAPSALFVGGEPQPFTSTSDRWSWGMWLSFEEPLPGLTGRAYGRRLEITLEAKKIPSNDYLYVCFGDDSDSSRSHFPYQRP